MRPYHVEGPRKRKLCDFSSWARISGKDGSTVAYVPSETLADQIAELLNEITWVVGEPPQEETE